MMLMSLWWPLAFHGLLPMMTSPSSSVAGGCASSMCRSIEPSGPHRPGVLSGVCASRRASASKMPQP